MATKVLALSLSLCFLLFIQQVLMFQTKKVEADGCGTMSCEFFGKICGGSCRCYPLDFEYFKCKPKALAREMADKDPNVCESHADCTKKRSGSFCGFYPNPYIKYGWCFVSKSHAQASFKKALRNEFSKLLKMPSAVST